MPNVHRWAVWQLRRGLRVHVLAVESVAVLLTAVCMVVVPVGSDDLVDLLWLSGCAAAGIEISRHTERRRERYKGERPYRSFHFVWIAPAIVLFPALACLLTAATYAWVWYRVNLTANMVLPHRWVYSAAANTVATALAALTYSQFTGSSPPTAVGSDTALPGLLLAAIVLVGTNMVLLAAVIRLSNPHATRQATWGNRDDQAISAGSACLGALVAIAYTAWPPMTLLVLPPLALAQHALLTAQLEHAARTDPKTGLLNVAYWHEMASRELDHARRLGDHLAVAIADLDHFKRVNDTYGHQAGDHVLRAVAHALTTQLRLYDTVGRFGGEEFVILLPSTTTIDALATAERLRQHIATLDPLPTTDDSQGEQRPTITVSIGVAVFPQHAASLDELIAAADAALYRAKHTGRNAVRCATGRQAA